MKNLLQKQTGLQYMIYSVKNSGLLTTIWRYWMKKLKKQEVR